MFSCHLVKLGVLFPDITLTNCWKVMAEVEPEYLEINMSTSILSTSNPPHHLLVRQINQVFSFPQRNLIFELLLIDDDKKFRPWNLTKPLRIKLIKYCPPFVFEKQLLQSQILLLGARKLKIINICTM